MEPVDLREVRREQGLTLAEVAERATARKRELLDTRVKPMHPQQISMYETEGVMPGGVHLYAYAAALGLDPFQVLLSCRAVAQRKRAEAESRVG